MINAPVLTHRVAPAVLALIAFGTLVAALIAAAVNAEIRTAVIGTLPLMARYAAVLMLPALLAWVAFTLLGLRVGQASLLALALAVGFAVYAGLAQSAALVLLLAAALAVGRFALNRPTEPSAGLLATATLGGLGIIIGIMGWLLPLPIHSSAASITVLALIVFAGRRSLAQSLAQLSTQWQQLGASHPATLFFSLAVAGFAAVFLWLPSLNPDDNSAHLLLGNQLLADGYFHLDASTQISSLGPWFNNVLHGLLVLVSGAEARPATALVWLLFGCTGAFRLAKVLRADDATALLAMAVYASHPLTAYYGTTLQVDGASAACLLHLSAMCIGLERDEQEHSAALLIGTLCGVLAALKVTNLVYLAFFGVWLLWRYARRGQLTRALVIVAVAAVIAGSSYFYATVVTGNPLFPLYNGIFKSAYMPPVNFADERWHSGFGPKVLWDLTFSTGKYMEAYTGAAGLALLALAGASLVAIVSGGWRAALTVIALLAGAIVFSQVQYLRYVFPAVVLATTVAVVVFFSFGYRRLGVSLMALMIVAQLGLAKTSNWILNSGVAEQLLTEGPSSVRRVEDHFVPERTMIRQLAAKKSRFCLLLAEPVTAYVALAPGKSLTTAFYDFRMNSLAQWANQDASGGRWRQSLDSVGVTDVELQPAQANAGLMAALAAEKFATTDSGESQLWSREGQSPDGCLDGLLRSRDEARRLFQ